MITQYRRIVCQHGTKRGIDNYLIKTWNKSQTDLVKRGTQLLDLVNFLRPLQTLRTHTQIFMSIGSSPKDFSINLFNPEYLFGSFQLHLQCGTFPIFFSFAASSSSGFCSFQQPQLGNSSLSSLCCQLSYSLSSSSFFILLSIILISLFLYGTNICNFLFN